MLITPAQQHGLQLHDLHEHLFEIPFAFSQVCFAFLRSGHFSQAQEHLQAINLLQIVKKQI